MIGRRVSHSRIVEKLGAGGMGVVYRAEDTHLDRSVAIKVLPAEAVADPERKRRFVLEAKSASALNHANIIHIYDIDIADGTNFIVMEYVPGSTLDQLIGRKGLPIGEALKYAVQIAGALAAAHAAGIVHRDLKPANVMVSEDGLVKVLDFGLAKLMESAQVDGSAATLTASLLAGQGAIVGTVAYMSPEQAEGKKVDARSDIFSFGSMLYEMVTGRRAFQRDSQASTIAAVLRDQPGPLAGMTGGVPHDLEQIIGRCLRKDPARRFQGMADVQVALDELKEEMDSGRRVDAAPLPPARRRKWIWAAGTLLVLLILGALGRLLLRRPAIPAPARVSVFAAREGIE